MAFSGHVDGSAPRNNNHTEERVAESSTSSPKGESKSSSRGGSRNSSRAGSRTPKEKQRVHFNAGGDSAHDIVDSGDVDATEEWFTPSRVRTMKQLPRPRINPAYLRSNSANSTRLNDSTVSQDIADSTVRSSIPPSRQSTKQSSSTDSIENAEEDLSNEDIMNQHTLQKALSQRFAQDKAQRLSRLINSQSAPGSKTASPARSRASSPDSSESDMLTLNLNNIPMQRLERRKKYSIEDDTDEDDENDAPPPAGSSNFLMNVAAQYFRRFKEHDTNALTRVEAHEPGQPSGQVTPTYEQDPETYVTRPSKYREGYLSSIFKLYGEQRLGHALANFPGGPAALARGNRRASLGEPYKDASLKETPVASLSSSGASTPARKHNKWYYKNAQDHSTTSIETLIASSAVLAQPGSSTTEEDKTAAIRPKLKHKPRSSGALDAVFGRRAGRKAEDSMRIQVHIAETLSRQKYLMKLCKALMTYGAPTHRLEGKRSGVWKP